jgi:hypothetical protein
VLLGIAAAGVFVAMLSAVMLSSVIDQIQEQWEEAQE